MLKEKEKKNDYKMRDVSFWKALLNIEEYRDEYGFVVYGMTDELFVEESEFYEELLLADNLFNGYYITHWDHLEYVPFVVRMRYIASFAAAG